MRKIKFSLPVAAFVLGIGLAMITGFSSFTNAHKSKAGLGTYTFVHPAHNTLDMKANYEYVSDPEDCSSSSNICTAEWTQNETPTEGNPPAADATEVPGSKTEGDYPNN